MNGEGGVKYMRVKKGEGGGSREDLYIHILFIHLYAHTYIYIPLN
jgi:hypothetical protein